MPKEHLRCDAEGQVRSRLQHRTGFNYASLHKIQPSPGNLPELSSRNLREAGRGPHHAIETDSTRSAGFALCPPVRCNRANGAVSEIKSINGVYHPAIEMSAYRNFC